MKKGLIKGLLVSSFVLVGALSLSLTSVNAESIYTELSDDTVIVTDQTYSLEEMLTYAIQDEYLAQAEYDAIIATYGDLRPFINVVVAEQTHIDLLTALFTTYGIEIPANTAVDSVIVPESITASFATAVDAETANIAMYQAFLSQTDLPDDVRSTFEYLVAASQTHLNAFSKDRYSGLGSDLMNQFKNQFKGSNGQGSGVGQGNQYKGSNGKGGNQYSGSNGNDGICTSTPILG